MMHRASSLLAAAALLALAACQQNTPAEDQPLDAQPGSTIVADPTPDATLIDTELPAAMQGQWGLVPADCGPGRDDAKGLMTVTPRELRFYESIGTLTEITEAAPNRIRAHFAFSGEGMSWERDMTLQTEDGGSTLIRQDYGQDAATEPFRYTKC